MKAFERPLPVLRNGAFDSRVLLFQDVLAMRRVVTVRADEGGVSVEGELVVARSKIAHGLYQPRPVQTEYKTEAQGPTVRLLSRRGRLLFEAEVATEDEGLELLCALGLDPGSKRAEFCGTSPLATSSTVFMAWGMAFSATSLALTVVTGVHPLLWFVAVLLFTALQHYPSKYVVGIDGVYIRWLWRQKFIPMVAIELVTPVDKEWPSSYTVDQTVLTLSSGNKEALYTKRRQKDASMGGPTLYRDAMLARIVEAKKAFLARESPGDISVLLGRGAMTNEAWLNALRELRADRGYRGNARNAVVDEDLWRIVEDSRAPEDVRTGAAVALRASLDEGGRARLRVAAEAVASPKLRVALDAAASDSDEHLLDAVDALASEERKARRRTA